MKAFVPVVLLVLAAFAVLFTIFGGESYSQLVSSQRALAIQKESNAELRDKVDGLRHEVSGLQSSPRAIEKAARNELVLSRPNEMIFIFEDEQSEGNSSVRRAASR